MRTVRISGIFRLAADAAESYARMRAESLPAGGINSAWRSTEGQRRIFLSRYERSRNRWLDTGPFGDVRKYEGVWYKRMRGYPVSVPGTSKHNQGLATDTSVDKPVAKWLKSHGGDHGWTQPLPGSDPVHWEYVARKDKAKRAKPKPGPHEVTARVLRGRSRPSLTATIVDRKRRRAVILVEAWVRGDGMEWGRTAEGIYYARDFLKPRV